MYIKLHFSVYPSVHRRPGHICQWHSRSRVHGMKIKSWIWKMGLEINMEKTQCLFIGEVTTDVTLDKLKTITTNDLWLTTERTV